MQISLDEGGARCVDGESRRYVPFSDVADVGLETRAFRRPVVVVTLRSGERVRLFAGAEALEIHRALVESLATRASRSEAEAPPEWRRDGRKLGEWLASVRVLEPGVGYRSAADPLARALAILGDASAAVDARAAAAHVAVRAEDEAALLACAKILAGRALPPLVVVAARAGEPAMMDDEALRDALSFLDDADRREAEAVLVGAASARHAAVMLEARRQLAEEALKAPPGTSAPGRTRREAAGTSRDASRWIGKNWGL